MANMNNTLQINSAADVQGLEQRQDRSIHISIVRLGALHEAPNCCRILRRVIHTRNWACPHFKIVEQFYGLVLKLDAIRILLNAAAAVNETVEGLLPTLMNLKMAGVYLKQIKVFIPTLKTSDLLLKSTVKLGEMIYGTARDVMRGSEPLAEFRDGVPDITAMINYVLDAPMSFPCHYCDVQDVILCPVEII